jgi:hypothetical protein
MKRISLLSAWTLSVLASAASAQTGAGLLLEPFEKDRSYEIEGSATFLFEGDTDTGDFQMTMYESQGRMKLDLDGVVEGINRAQPRAGYETPTTRACPGSLSICLSAAASVSRRARNGSRA